nr:AAA family ATPase [Aeromicrobium duanguangcaii]
MPTDFRGGEWLDPAQARTVRGLAGSHRLVVVEGAAGSGKTKTLAATKQLVESCGHRMVVVTPTLKAAQVAPRETGAAAFSAAWLAHQHGHRWDEDGQWTRTAATPRADAVLRPGDLLLVDEAGMLDQDTARALLAVADEAGARVAFAGDRHQLPAVGRGGVLDLAINHAHPTARLTLDTIHRFSDPAYAELSLAMRTGTKPEAVFDQFLARGQIRLHSDEDVRTKALVDAAAGGALVMADDRQTVTALNWEITRALVSNRRIGGDNRYLTVGTHGDMVFTGSRIATRRNDRDFKVANRDAWTVTALGRGGSLRVVGDAGARTLPASYVREFVELAHATTVHGAQGTTVPSAHFSVGDSTNAMAAYVAMTRGRHANVSHLIADSPPRLGSSGSRCSAVSRPTSAPPTGRNRLRLRPLSTTILDAMTGRHAILESRGRSRARRIQAREARAVPTSVFDRRRGSRRRSVASVDGRPMLDSADQQAMVVIKDLQGHAVVTASRDRPAFEFVAQRLGHPVRVLGKGAGAELHHGDGDLVRKLIESPHRGRRELDPPRLIGHRANRARTSSPVTV